MRRGASQACKGLVMKNEVFFSCGTLSDSMSDNAWGATVDDSTPRQSAPLLSSA